MSPQEQLRLAVERDINLVLAACMPDDWTTPAPQEVVRPCVHPDNEIKGNMVLGYFCWLCGARVPIEQVVAAVRRIRGEAP